MCLHPFLARLSLAWLLLATPTGALLGATVNWDGGGNGTSWHDPLNWSGGALPQAGDDVVITSGGGASVVLSTGTHSAASIVSQKPFVLSGGTLTVGGTIQVNSTFSLTGGTLAGATVLAGSGGQGITASNGTLSGVTLAADVLVGSGSSLRIANGLTLSGGATITLNSAAVLFPMPGTQTIGGTGQIILGGTSSSPSISLGSAGPSFLTLGPDVVVRGHGVFTQSTASTLINEGLIQADVAGRSLSVSLGNFTNEGTVEVRNGATMNISAASWTNSGTLNAVASTLTLGGNWSNSGTLSVTDSTVNLGGTFTQAGLGNFTRTGGSVNVTGTLTGGLALDATTGSWNLGTGGTLSGGTVSAVGGALLASSSGTLSGVTLAADMLVGSGSSLRIANGLTLSGGATITLNSAAVLFPMPGTQTIGGTGQIILGGTSSSPSISLGSAGPSFLTLGPDVVVRGHGVFTQSTASTLINEGLIQADVAGRSLIVSLGNFTNEGTVEVRNGATMNISAASWSNSGTLNAVASTLTLGGNWSNSGTLSVTDSTVNLGGTFTQAGLGNFIRIGGAVNLTGTLTGGLALDAGTGTWVVSGMINGGTVTGADVVQLVAAGGTLTDVTLEADVSIGNGNILHIGGSGLTLVGGATITLHNSGSVTDLRIAPGTQTIGGTGQIILSGTSVFSRVMLGSGGSSSLTLGPAVTVRGHGNITQNAASTLINQGLIQADVAGRILTISPGNFTNEGTIEVLNGATMNISAASWSNSGDLTVEGSTLTVSGNWSNTGTFTVTDSTVTLGGTFTQAGLGNFTRTGGTVNLTGTLTGGLALDATTGSWTLGTGGTLSGGTVSATGGALLDSFRGTFSGVTLAADVLVARVGSLHIVNGLTLTGGATITLDFTPGAPSALNFSPGNQFLAGEGRLLMSGSVIDLGNGGPTTLTLGPNILVEGPGTIRQTSASTLINQGIIRAQVPGQTLTISPGNFTNEGTVEVRNGATMNISAASWTNTGSTTATGATLTIGGAWNNPGTLTATNSTVNLSGVLRNVGLPLNLTGPSSSLNLSGGAIEQGAVDLADGARLTANASTNNRLDGVTLNGNGFLTVDGARLTITNGMILNGVLQVGHPTINWRGGLRFAGTQTLGGNGELVFGMNTNNALFGAQPNTTLTLGPGIKTRGVHGTLGSFSGTPWSGAINLTVVNQGKIEVLFGSNFSVMGDFIQTASGRLDLQVAGTAANLIGSLDVSGHATLDGRLRVRVAAGYVPQAGPAYRIVNYGSHSGAFANVEGLLPAPDVRWGPVYNLTGLDLLNRLPGIGVGPLSQTVNLNDSLILEVTPTGVGPFTYQWRLNGANLPGATGAQLVLSNIQIHQAGRYSVVVSNAEGAVESAPAVIKVNLPALPFHNNFASAGTVDGNTVQGAGLSGSATLEAGEPQHVNKPGGRSLWLRWSPTNSGVATIDLAGSSFDTLLAVYTGSQLSDLVEVAANDDAIATDGSVNPFLTSRVGFNAVFGTVYHIAVDGLGGTGGDVALTLNLDALASALPRIVSQSGSRSAEAGESFSLVVSATGTGTLSYQWFFNGAAINGATAATLPRNNFTRPQVGTYHVRVTDGVGQFVNSRPVSLELGSDPTVTSENKFVDTLTAPGGPQLQGRPRPQGFTPVALGIPGTQVFSTLASSREPGEPQHHATLGGASRWFQVRVETNGVLVVDTIGSDLDTVLSLYAGTDLLELVQLASDDNGAPDGVRSLIRVPVEPGDYTVAVDGVNGAKGIAQLNWLLAEPPRLALNSVRSEAREGLGLELLIADPGPGFMIQWYRDGVAVPGAMGPRLLVNPVEVFNAGSYTVRISNAAGEQVLEVAAVEVAKSIWLREVELLPGAGFNLHITVPEDGTYTLESSEDFDRWDPVQTTDSVNGVLQLNDPESTDRPLRFYRVVRE